MHQLALVSVTAFLHSNSPNYLCQPFNRGWKSISCTIYSKKKTQQALSDEDVRSADYLRTWALSQSQGRYLQ